MISSPVKLNRNDHIKFNFKGKVCTGSILHSSKVKTYIFKHENKSNDGYITVVSGKTQSMRLEIISVDEIDEEYQDLVSKLTSVKKGDVVKVKGDNCFVGYLENITAKGYTITNHKDSYVYPFEFLIEQGPTVSEKAMPLDQWFVKSGHSKEMHHDGGACQKQTFYFNNKKVFVVTENAWSGPADIQNIAQVRDLDASDAFKQDSLESFKIAGVSKECMFFADSADCVGQWLAKRKLVSLKDQFKPL